MEFKAPKSELVKLVSRAACATDAKSTMPILANVKLSVADGKLTVAGTDLYMCVVGETDATIRKPGDVCLPARDFLERLRALPDGEITVSVKDTGIAELKGSTARRFRINGLPGDNFPPTTEETAGAQTFTVDAKVLLAIIGRVSYAISSDNTRAHLNSMQLVGSTDTLTGTSTDGHRLASSAEKVDVPEFNLLLSQRAVNELKRMLGDEAGSVEVKLVGSNVMFGFSWGSFSAKLVDALFPNVNEVMPRNFSTTARVPRTALLEAVKAVALAASERNGGVKLAFSAGTLALSTESPDSGSSDDEVPVEFSGEDVTIGVNAKYLQEAVSCLQVDEVLFSMGSGLDPILITSSECEGYRAVVMPLRL